jgi:hypothetical protein
VILYFPQNVKTILVSNSNCMFLVLSWLQQFFCQNQHNVVANPTDFVHDWEVSNTMIVVMRRGELKPNESHYFLTDCQVSYCKPELCEVNTSKLVMSTKNRFYYGCLLFVLRCLIMYDVLYSEHIMIQRINRRI